MASAGKTKQLAKKLGIKATASTSGFNRATQKYLASRIRAGVNPTKAVTELFGTTQKGTISKNFGAQQARIAQGVLAQSRGSARQQGSLAGEETFILSRPEFTEAERKRMLKSVGSDTIENTLAVRESRLREDRANLPRAKIVERAGLATPAPGVSKFEALTGQFTPAPPPPNFTPVPAEQRITQPISTQATAEDIAKQKEFVRTATSSNIGNFLVSVSQKKQQQEQARQLLESAGIETSPVVRGLERASQATGETIALTGARGVALIKDISAIDRDKKGRRETASAEVERISQSFLPESRVSSAVVEGFVPGKIVSKTFNFATGFFTKGKIATTILSDIQSFVRKPFVRPIAKGTDKGLVGGTVAINTGISTLEGGIVEGAESFARTSAFFRGFGADNKAFRQGRQFADDILPKKDIQPIRTNQNILSDKSARVKSGKSPKSKVQRRKETLRQTFDPKQFQQGNIRGQKTGRASKSRQELEILDRQNAVLRETKKGQRTGLGRAIEKKEVFFDTRSKQPTKEQLTINFVKGNPKQIGGKAFSRPASQVKTQNNNDLKFFIVQTQKQKGLQLQAIQQKRKPILKKQPELKPATFKQSNNQELILDKQRKQEFVFSKPNLSPREKRFELKKLELKKKAQQRQTEKNFGLFFQRAEQEAIKEFNLKRSLVTRKLNTQETKKLTQQFEEKFGKQKNIFDEVLKKEKIKVSKPKNKLAPTLDEEQATKKAQQFAQQTDIDLALNTKSGGVLGLQQPSALEQEIKIATAQPQDLKLTTKIQSISAQLPKQETPPSQKTDTTFLQITTQATDFLSTKQQPFQEIDIINKPFTTPQPKKQPRPQNNKVFSVRNSSLSGGGGFRIPLPPPIPSFDATGGKEQAYDAFVREKGKFIKANNKPMTKRHAKAYASDIVDNSASASFTIKKTSGKPQPTPLGTLFVMGGKFRKSKKNKKVIVEKRTFRIDTAGEKQGITAKGLIALRQKQKKQRNFFKGGLKL